MTKIKIRIGWTKSDPATGYSSFGDGYRTGAPQHVETLDVEIPEDYTHERVADAAFMATNYPEPSLLTGLAAQIWQAIDDTGYHGHGAHYSLSVGDTVTVGDITLACDLFGWKLVDLEVEV